MKKLNRKGFTLIELLAVIVILGVILIIAIPSISAAILNARKNAYVDTADQLVDAVRIGALSNPTILPSGTNVTIVKLAAIKLEKGSKEKSPFGGTYNVSSYIRIDYDDDEDEYVYSICLTDGTRGIPETDIREVTTGTVDLTGGTCGTPDGTITQTIDAVGELYGNW